MGDITFTQDDFRLDINIDEVRWPNGKSFPADSPKCGFDGLGCSTPYTDITPTAPDDNSKIGRLNELFFCTLVLASRNIFYYISVKLSVISLFS